MTITPDEQITLTNRLMRERIAPVLPPGYCATLVVFQHSQANGLTTYISNADRATSVKALVAIADRLEGGPHGG